MHVPLPIANDSPTTLPWSVSVVEPPPPNDIAVGEGPVDVTDPVPFAVASAVAVVARVEVTICEIVAMINKNYKK